MIYLNELRIKGYKNIKKADLTTLSDLNIFIGPNNSGKSNILKLIEKIFVGEVGNDINFLCVDCQRCRKEVYVDLDGYRNSLSDEDFYLNRTDNDIEITLRLNDDLLHSMLPDLSTVTSDMNWEFGRTYCTEYNETIMLKGVRNTLNANHLSPILRKEVFELLNPILFSPDTRLETYKNIKINEYFRDRSLSTNQKTQLITFLREMVDKQLIDERSEQIIREIEGRKHESSIFEQGSGVRSLLCLAIDILFSESKLILIDEPELGLNPKIKQNFLLSLIQQCGNSQVFIATHDPTFVNPILWPNEKVSVFLYSLTSEGFKKIDLNASKHDPSTFAGYLPHTVSLKDIHIYVEGPSDVYIYQIFLLKYLKKKYNNWAEIWNRVGIYHLGGDYWSHLLYTIPRHPYNSYIILDKDKSEVILKAIKKYENEFMIAENINDITNINDKKITPIYCLKKGCIEEYIEGERNYKDLGYNKKIDGPKYVDEMNYVPEEINKIFDAIFIKHKLSN